MRVLVTRGTGNLTAVALLAAASAPGYVTNVSAGQFLAPTFNGGRIQLDPAATNSIKIGDQNMTSTQYDFELLPGQDYSLESLGRQLGTLCFRNDGAADQYVNLTLRTR